MHGTRVGDFQHDVDVENNAVTGTLVYQEDTPIAQTMADGYFLALRYENIDPTLTELLISLQGVAQYVNLLEVEDKHTVFYITPGTSTEFEVVQKRGAEEKTMVFDLTGLQFEQ